MIKKCEFCGNDFDAKTGRAKFCSDAHRYQAWKKAGGLGNVTETQTPTIMKPTPIPTPQGMDFGTQMIFDMLKKESSRFEDAYNKEKDAKEKLQEKNNELEKQLLQTKHESEKTLMQNAKPSGLQGFVETNPTIIEKAIEHIGPHIGTALGKLFGGNDPEFPAGDELKAWLAQQPQNIQIDFMHMVNGLIKVGAEKGADKMAEKLSEIVRSLMSVANDPKAQQHLNGPRRANAAL